MGRGRGGLCQSSLPHHGTQGGWPRTQGGEGWLEVPPTPRGDVDEPHQPELMLGCTRHCPSQRAPSREPNGHPKPDPGRGGDERDARPAPARLAPRPPQTRRNVAEGYLTRPAGNATKCNPSNRHMVSGQGARPERKWRENSRVFASRLPLGHQYWVATQVLSSPHCSQLCFAAWEHLRKALGPMT